MIGVHLMRTWGAGLGVGASLRGVSEECISLTVLFSTVDGDRGGDDCDPRLGQGFVDLGEGCRIVLSPDVWPFKTAGLIEGPRFLNVRNGDAVDAGLGHRQIMAELEKARQLCRYFFWSDGRGVALEHGSVPSNEELGEIPNNVGVAVLVGMVSLQEVVQRSGTISVDFDLGEHWEGHVIVGGREFENLGITAGLLGAELVAWKAKNSEASILVVFMKSTQTCVLGSKASGAGDVHDQADLVLVGSEADLLAGDGCHG